MATEKFEKNRQNSTNDDAAVKPDPETMQTTDPQEHMKGPVSSIMKTLEGVFDSNESKEEADKERDKHM